MRRNTRLFAALLVIAMVVGLLLGTEPAAAGAPNWECRIGRHTVAFDQHDKIAVIRVAGVVTTVPLETPYQNGYETNQTFTFNELVWKLEIRSAKAVGTVDGAKVAGVCAMVTGDHGPQVATKTVMLYASRSSKSKVVRRIPIGSIWWKPVRYGADSVADSSRWAAAIVVNQSMRTTSGFVLDAS
jgi:hypothetical protein